MRIRFILLFIFSLFIKNGFGTDYYPGSTTYADGVDAEVAAYLSEVVFTDVDTRVGISSGGTLFYGFPWFPGGFNINGDAGTVSFGSPFPVGTHINLDGQLELRLRSDLLLAVGVGLEAGVNSSGIMDCNGFGIVLTGDFVLPSDGVGSERYIEFVDSGGRLSANGNVVDFSPGGYFKINSSATYLSLRDAYCRCVQSNSFQFNSTTDTLYLWNSVLNLAEDVVFDFNVSVVGDLLVTGTHTLCFNRNIEFNDESKIIFDVGTTFSYGASASLSFGARRLGSFHFNGCDILIGDNDFNMSDGRIIFENEVTIDDNGNYGEFVIGANTGVDVLGNARIVLENTTTFSIL